MEANPERDLIHKFIKQSSGTKFKTLNIFSVQRRGEPERFEKWIDQTARKVELETRKKDWDPDCRLLFHGTSMHNVLGILGQGMRIAPPESDFTGAMFGNGIYFADQFDKSANYSSGHST